MYCTYNTCVVHTRPDGSLLLNTNLEASAPALTNTRGRERERQRDRESERERESARAREREREREERGPPSQKSRVECLKAKVEPLLMSKSGGLKALFA